MNEIPDFNFSDYVLCLDEKNQGKICIFMQFFMPYSFFYI